VRFENATWDNYLKTIDKESIDFILTDPPYNVLKEEHDILGDPDMKELAGLFFQILKPNCKIAIFCSFEQIFRWNEHLKSAGFKMQQVPLIITHSPNGNYYFKLIVYKQTTGGQTMQCRSQFVVIGHKGSGNGLNFNWKVIFYY
jgi:tRNA1(Val) A37 N6-methylase TrmN6